MSRKRCSAPSAWRQQCSKAFVKAHTVPRASLKRIAASGHVLSFVPNAANLERYGTALRPQQLGVGRASTFTGFCSRHDDAIFAPLEKRTFTGTSEQCFLLAYRALARELHLKRATLEYWDARFGKTKPGVEFAPPVARSMLSGFLRGTRKGEADMTSHKRDYDEVLLAENYEDVRAHVIELSDPPAVMCSGGIVPEHTFLGEQLIDLVHHRGRLSLLSVSSFADGARGFVVFAWLEDGSNYCERLVKSVNQLSDIDLTSSLIRFVFECCENVHMRPSWWEGLPASVQDELVVRMDGSSEFTSRDRARNFFRTTE